MRYNPLRFSVIFTLLAANCLVLASCGTRVMKPLELTGFIENALDSELLSLDEALITKTAGRYPNTAFYAAYLIEKRFSGAAVSSEQRKTVSNLSFNLYKAALQDRAAGGEAASKLIFYVLEDKKQAARFAVIKPETAELRTLKAASLLALERYGEIPALYESAGKKSPPLFISEKSDWDKALLIMTRLRLSGSGGSQTDALDFLFDGNLGDERRWLYDEISADDLSLIAGAYGVDVINASLKGRKSLADYGYRAALDFFKIAYTEDASLFERYPALTGDLGRAYISGGLQEEGAKLFIEWEEKAASAIPQDTIKRLENRDFRYKCMYYAGRLRRALGKRESASACFEKAVELAPDDEQRDACLWYIIEIGFNEKTAKGADLLEKWANKWHDGDYFSDHYDKIAQWAASENKWTELLRFFPAIESGNSGITRVKFAYIIGRAIEDGHIKQKDLEARPRAGMKNGELRAARDFFAIAYLEDAPFYRDEPSLYYKAMAASRLGLSPSFIPEEQLENAAYEITSQKGQVILGFFKHGAGKYTPALIKDNLSILPNDEIRAFAKLLSDEGQYGEAIRICVAMMKKPDYNFSRGDIELCFPLGQQNLIERFAGEYELDKGILFGLVRTESIFIPDIVSHAGAVGLAQLMPQTALDTAKTIARTGGPNYITDDTVDRTDPEVNLHIGSYFLRHLMKTQATPLNAILSYNGGPSRIRRWAAASGLSPDLFMESISLKETREYGKKVLGCAILYDYYHFGTIFNLENLG